MTHLFFVGGHSEKEGGTIATCYTLGSNVPVASMNKKRKWASSVTIGDTLWVTGGDDENFNELQSSEFVNPQDGTVLDGPALPKPSSSHCVVMINASTVILIGDFTGEDKASWFYNFDNEESGWLEGPNLNMMGAFLWCHHGFKIGRRDTCCCCRWS